MTKTIIAITGPSGAGKTTLGNLLEQRFGVVTPKHCTTRNPRSDDRIGFYRYLTHDEYKKYFDQKAFAITSGDSTEIKKENGNFYGVLTNDILETIKNNDKILLYISYKDIEQFNSLKSKGYNTFLINITFKDIKKGVYDRITQDKNRNHTEQDIKNRIYLACEYESKYRKELNIYIDCLIYTDMLTIEESYQKFILDFIKIQNLEK